MTIVNPIVPPPPLGPVVNVTPLTYRDGMTLLEKVEYIQRYVNGFPPVIEVIMQDLVNTVNEQLANEQIWVESEIQDLTDYVNEQVAAIIGSSITVQDPVVAGLVNDPSSATSVALSNEYATNENVTSSISAEQNARISGDAVRAVARVWDGGAYPARIEGSTNIFFGDADPGVLMDPVEDFWAIPDSTTMDSVVSATTDPTTPLFAAIQSATTGNVIDLPLVNADVEVSLFKNVGIAGNSLCGYELSASTGSSLYSDITVPYGWNTAKVRVYYYVPATAGSGDVRIGAQVTPYKEPLAPPASQAVNNTIAAPANGVIGSFLLTVAFDVTNMPKANVRIQRVGASSSDTLNSVIYLIGARLEKVS